MGTWVLTVKRSKFLERGGAVDLLVSLDRTHETRVESYRQAVNTYLEIRCMNLKQTLTLINCWSR